MRFRIPEGRLEDFDNEIRQTIDDTIVKLERAVTGLKGLNNPREKIVGLEFAASYLKTPEFYALSDAAGDSLEPMRHFEIAERLGFIEDAEAAYRTWQDSGEEAFDLGQFVSGESA